MMQSSSIMNYYDPMLLPLELSVLFRTEKSTLAAYADTLRGHVHAGFRILEAIVETDWLPQIGDLVEVTVLIDTPPDDMDLWPIDRLIALRMAIEKVAWQFRILETVYVRMLSMRSVVEAGLPADVIARARLAAERPFEPEEA